MQEENIKSKYTAHLKNVLEQPPYKLLMKSINR